MLGISSIIIEDKKGLKRILFYLTRKARYRKILKFFLKNFYSKKAQLSSDFMIIARIEFYFRKNLNDAIKRAHAYIDAGADGIMIHSKSNNPKEIFNFSKFLEKNYKEIPLISVPSSYNQVKEKELYENGFNIVIYANHLFRAAYPAMKEVAKNILSNSRSKEVDKKLLSIKKY